MRKWEELDEQSGINFCIEETETGKLRLNCTFNKIKVNIRDYEFTDLGLLKLKKIVQKVFKEY